MIFSDVDRKDAGPKLSRESMYAFMDRSADELVSRARELLERLVAKYPEGEQSELIARFRSGKDEAYRSAEFELILYSFLSSRGYKLEPHPTLPNGTGARPDFLVTSPDGCKFYLEAVNTSEGDVHILGDALTKQTLDVLRTNAHPNFCVGVRTMGRPQTQPSGRKFVRCILKWLDGLDPDAVENQKREGSVAPSITWCHEDLKIEITAMPLPQGRRKKSRQLLRLHSGELGWVRPQERIRDALCSKGNKYGKPDHPFVIAVNFEGYGLRRTDEVAALFGDEVFVVQFDGADDDGDLRRKPNGAWIGVGGPVFTRVAGAWIFDGLSPFFLAECSGTLYLNPFAEKAAPSSLREFAHAYEQDGQLVWVEGPTMGNILDYPTATPDL